MSLDWLWGAAIGLGASVASGVLGWYKGAGALQQKQIDTADALAKLTVNFDNLKTDLTNKLEAYRREAELSEDSVHDQISGVLHEVSDMTTIVKVSLAEQNAGLKQTVQLLDGLTRTVEKLRDSTANHETALAVHGKQIEQIQRAGLG